MPSPTALTLRRLRADGYLPAVVERWVDRLKIRVDLWHFGDVLAVHPGRREFLIVQATTLANLSARLAKTREQPPLRTWLDAGGKVQLHGWCKRRGRWTAKVVEVRGEDLALILDATAHLARPLRAFAGALEGNRISFYAEFKLL